MKICIPIKVKTQKEALKMLKKVAGKTGSTSSLPSADIAEIWLDHIKDLDIPALLKNKPLPVLCVCKKPQDKGLFKGNYAQMAEVLLEAIKCGADYVDIPWQGKSIKDSGLSKLLNKKVIQQSVIIISYHNFQKTPPLKKLYQMARDMKKRGADIVKIAVMANILDDTFSIISLAQTLKEEGIAHILIAMGEKGILSRVITPLLGGNIMFAPLTKKGSTASGQLTVKELRKAWGMFK